MPKHLKLWVSLQCNHTLLYPEYVCTYVCSPTTIHYSSIQAGIEEMEAVSAAKWEGERDYKPRGIVMMGFPRIQSWWSMTFTTNTLVRCEQKMLHICMMAFQYCVCVLQIHFHKNLYYDVTHNCFQNSTSTCWKSPDISFGPIANLTAGMRH